MTNTIKNLINPNNLGYSKGHTNLCDDGKTYEFFKLESDGYVYVLCIDTNRATRYNGEGQNGKRISMDAYLTARETLEHEAAIKELDKAAENPEISLEQFVAIIEQAEEDATTEAIEEIQKEMTIDLESIATKTANRVVEYEHTEDAAEREDSFKTPNDVRAYADRYGWYDEIECDVDLSDDDVDELNEMITKKVIDLLFPKAKKVRKPRKSKDTFHTSTVVPGLTLTAKQTSFILHLSDTNFWENGLDSCIWVDILCDEIGGEFAGKPMTVGAMISTLCEKGLGSRATERREGRKCTSFELTETGKLVAAEVGLQ